MIMTFDELLSQRYQVYDLLLIYAILDLLWLGEIALGFYAKDSRGLCTR